MKTEKFVLGPVGTNCYIVRNEAVSYTHLEEIMRITDAYIGRHV